MNKPLPDKWIRKAIFTAVNGQIVSGKTVNVYDWNVPEITPEVFVRFASQSNNVSKQQKCSHYWSSTVTLEINVRTIGAINEGSRLLADDISNMVLQQTNNLVLDVASNLKIITQTEFMPDDLMSDTDEGHLYRKFIQYDLLIN